MTTYLEQLEQLIESYAESRHVTIQISVSKTLLDSLNDEIPGTKPSWEPVYHCTEDWPQSFGQFIAQ